MNRNISVCTASFLIALLFLYYLIYEILQGELTELDHSSSQNGGNDHESSVDAILLWWTPFLTGERLKTCGTINCRFTANRSYLTDSKLKGLMFYGSSIDVDDMPPRSDHLWGLFHEESPRNVPVLSHDAALSLFNYSATFSRASHLPLTLQYLPSLGLLISKKFYQPYEVKQRHREYLAPVMYLQSDCSTPNNRDSYVAELMKYIQVDSYGKCLNNRELPASLQYNLDTIMSDELMNMTSRYKFAIAFENAICEDYITEKLWRPLIAGTVPIYVGSPSIRDWLPNNNSAIIVGDFETPEVLAQHLLYLDANQESYEAYLLHKTESAISNEDLVRQFSPSWPEDSLGVVDDFECLMCGKSFSKENSVLTKSHYDCPEPRSILTGKPNESNWWYRDYLSASCEAEAFKNFVLTKRSLNEKFHFDESTCRLLDW